MISLSLALDLVKTAVGLAGVVIAGMGLRTWRRQLRGSAAYDRARRLYRTVLEVRDQLMAVRSPIIMSGETHAAFRDAGIETASIDLASDRRADRLVYDRRWAKAVRAMSDLRSELLEAEVLWGSEVYGPEKQLRVCMADLMTAVEWHLDQREDSNATVSPELAKKYRALLYAVPGRPDEHSESLNQVVARFEAIVRPHLR